MTIKEKLKSLAQNSIVLNIARKEKYKLCGTRFGGQPDVPEGFVWPTFEGEDYCGDVAERPLAFLAQINCEEIAPFDKEHLLPDHGLLSFFYSVVSEPAGFDPKDKGGIKVYWFEDLSVLSKAEFPEDLDEDSIFPMVKIKLRNESSYPCWEDFMAKFPETEYDEAFEEAQEELEVEEPEESSKLLGWPDVNQSSMFADLYFITKGYYLGNSEGYAKITEKEKEEAKTAIDRWQLLFQLDIVECGDFMLMLGDCGRLYVFIQKDDLLNRNFDNVWGFMQSN